MIYWHFSEELIILLLGLQPVRENSCISYVYIWIQWTLSVTLCWNALWNSASHKYVCALLRQTVQLWLMATTVILALILHQCWLQIKDWPASLGVLQGINAPTHNTTASLPNSVAWCVRGWLLVNTPYLHWDHLGLSAASQTAAQWKQLHWEL